jgi:hypothetical protein
MDGMHGAGKGSSPPKFRLEGFEKDPESVKKTVARSGDKAGGYNNPAVEKRVSLWSIHLDRQKNASKEAQDESRGFFLLQTSPKISPAPPFPKRGIPPFYREGRRDFVLGFDTTMA